MNELRNKARRGANDVPLIRIVEVTKVYDLGEHQVNALQGVTLQINEGEFVAIMGPSGSGKSTMMNILGALDTPSSGRFILDGIDTGNLRDDALAEIRNSKIGFVFQNFNLLPRLSALKQVELPLIYAGRSDRRNLAKTALVMVGLGDRLEHKPSELSGGQQQRVAIARALVNNPAIILADEPTGNLDSESGVEIMEVLQRLNRESGITIICVTHDPWIARHSQRVIRLADGRVVGDEPIEEPLIAGQSKRPSDAALIG